MNYNSSKNSAFIDRGASLTLVLYMVHFSPVVFNSENKQFIIARLTMRDIERTNFLRVSSVC